MYIVFIQHNNPFRRCKSRALWCAESSASCLGICPQKSQPREIPPKSGDFQAGYLHQTYALTNRIKRNFRSWLRALDDLEASPLPSVVRNTESGLLSHLRLHFVAFLSWLLSVYFPGPDLLALNEQFGIGHFYHIPVLPTIQRRVPFAHNLFLPFYTSMGLVSSLPFSNRLPAVDSFSDLRGAMSPKLAFFKRRIRLRRNSSISIPLGFVLLLPCIVIFLIISLVLSHPSHPNILKPAGSAPAIR